MNAVLEFLKKMMESNLVKTAIAIAISVIVYKVISNLLKKSEEKNSQRGNRPKDKTYIRLIRNFMKYAFFIIVFLIILQINGVDVSSMVAGVGVLSIIVGFVIQDAFKDIIRGIDIVSDNYFSVGDVVKYDGFEGKVLVVGLKTTQIENLKTKNVVSIANRNIEQVEVVSGVVDVEIPMPYEVSLDKAEAAISELVEELKADDRIKSIKYLGVNNLSSSSIDYIVSARCNPPEKLQVRRDIIRKIIVVLDKNNIEIPYQQIDVHNK